VRATSARRRADHGKRGAAVVGKDAKARALDESPGPLAYLGEDAVKCPECGVGLDPARTRHGELLPRHARFGHKVRLAAGPSQRPLCRGCVPEPRLAESELPRCGAAEARSGA